MLGKYVKLFILQTDEHKWVKGPKCLARLWKGSHLLIPKKKKNSRKVLLLDCCKNCQYQIRFSSIAWYYDLLFILHWVLVTKCRSSKQVVYGGMREKNEFIFSIYHKCNISRSAVKDDDEWPSKYSKVFLEVSLLFITS